MQKYVNVYLLNSPYHIDKPFTYSLPEEHSLKDIKEGTLVSVPFGRSDRASFGVVVGFDAPTENIKVKPVRSVLDDRFSLSEEMLGLCLFLKEHTLCTVGEALRAIIPSPVFSHDGPRNIKKKRIYRLNVLQGEAEIYSGERESDGNIKCLRSASHRKIVSYLKDGESDADTICRELGVSLAQINALLTKGILSYTEKEVLRNPYASIAAERDTSEIVLNRAQTAAYDGLLALYKEEKASASQSL